MSALLCGSGRPRGSYLRLPGAGSEHSKSTALYTKGANFCLVEAEEMTLSRPVRREYLSSVVAPANKGFS
jgi:hypothetical protein